MNEHECLVGVPQEILTVMGHWLYCRKCLAPELKGEGGETLIHLPDKTKDCSQWLEVLAVGQNVGTARRLAKKELTSLGLHRTMENVLKKGDMVFCPNDHPWGIKHSPYAPDGVEFFIDESVPIMAWRPEQ